MTPSKVNDQTDQNYIKGQGYNEDFQRCEFCNVPIYRNPCCDERSSTIFKGKGKMLCTKCAAILSNMPEEQALRALNNASETYPNQ